MMLRLLSLTAALAILIVAQVNAGMTLKEFCDEAERSEISRCLGGKLPQEVKDAVAPTMATLGAKDFAELGEKLCAELEKDPNFKPAFGGNADKNREEFLKALDQCQ